MQWPQYWPRVAREIASATVLAVTTVLAARGAAGASRSEFDEALSLLAALPTDQVVATHSAMVRELVETAHPDGVTADDAHDVLRRCGGASVWLPELEFAALATVLTGALGVAEAEDDPVSAQSVRVAALVLIAELSASAHTPIAEATRRALDEIARAETIEMP